MCAAVPAVQKHYINRAQSAFSQVLKHPSVSRDAEGNSIFEKLFAQSHSNHSFGLQSLLTYISNSVSLCSIVKSAPSDEPCSFDSVTASDRSVQFDSSKVGRISIQRDVCCSARYEQLHSVTSFQLCNPCTPQTRGRRKCLQQVPFHICSLHNHLSNKCNTVTRSDKLKEDGMIKPSVA